MGGGNKKQTDMKRKKLTLIADTPTYHSFSFGEYNGMKGYFYSLSDRLTDDQKIELTNKYNNVVILQRANKYAPELVNDCLFVANKVIKK